MDIERWAHLPVSWTRRASSEDECCSRSTGGGVHAIDLPGRSVDCPSLSASEWSNTRSRRAENCRSREETELWTWSKLNGREWRNWNFEEFSLPLRDAERFAYRAGRERLANHAMSQERFTRWIKWNLYALPLKVIQQFTHVSVARKNLRLNNQSIRSTSKRRGKGWLHGGVSKYSCDDLFIENCFRRNSPESGEINSINLDYPRERKVLSRTKHKWN